MRFGRCCSTSAGSTTGWVRRSSSRRGRLAPEYGHLAANRAAAELFHFADDAGAEGSGEVATAAWTGWWPSRSRSRSTICGAIAAHDIHRQTSLCRGMERDIATLAPASPVAAVAERCEMLPHAAVHPVSIRSISGLFERPGDLASAMHPQTISRLRDERQSVAGITTARRCDCIRRPSSATR